MADSVNGKRVAILVEEGFEDTELSGPAEILRNAGVTVVFVGPSAGAEYRGKRGQVVVAADVSVKGRTRRAS